MIDPRSGSERTLVPPEHPATRFQWTQWRQATETDRLPAADDAVLNRWMRSGIVGLAIAPVTRRGYAGLDAQRTNRNGDRERKGRVVEHTMNREVNFNWIGIGNRA